MCACSYSGCSLTFDSFARVYEHEKKFHRSQHPRRPLACDACRVRKNRCSGKRPACSACLRLQIPCSNESAEKKKTVQEDGLRAKEHPYAVWDPYDVFNQWDKAFNSRIQDQVGRPESSNRAETERPVLNQSYNTGGLLSHSKTKSPFIDGSPLAPTYDRKLNAARTPSLSPPYMRPASVSPSPWSCSSDHFENEPGNQLSQIRTPTKLPHSAAQSSESSPRSVEPAKFDHQQMKRGYNMPITSTLSYSIRHESEQMLQSYNISQSSPQPNDLRREACISGDQEGTEEVHEETETRRMSARPETPVAKNDRSSNVFPSAFISDEPGNSDRVPEEDWEDKSKSRRFAKEAPQTGKRCSSNDPPRTYTCDTCVKTFTRRNIWDNHRRTHTNERPFICSFALCGMTFKQKNEQTRHEQSKHKQKRFVCGGVLPDGRRWGCGKRFARSDGLLEHHTKTTKGRICLISKGDCSSGGTCSFREGL